MLYNPVLLIRHEVRDCFLGHGECGAPAVSRVVFRSRCFSTIGHYIEMSGNVVRSDLKQSLPLKEHCVGIHLLWLIKEGHNRQRLGLYVATRGRLILVIVGI